MNSCAHTPTSHTDAPADTNAAYPTHLDDCAAPTVYVRPARPSDAQDIATLHAARMRTQLEVFTGHALSEASAANIKTEDFIQRWAQTINEREAPGNVLTLRDENGFAGFGAGILTPLDGENTPAYTITAFELDERLSLAPTYAGPLMASLADHARNAGAGVLVVWLFSGDDAATRLFAQAGFAPAGTMQEFEIDGVTLVQHAWWAELE